MKQLLNEPNIYYRFLEWDTNFFGIKIAKIIAPHEECDFKSVFTTLKKEGCELAYVETPYNSDIDYGCLLETTFGTLLDIKCLYAIDVNCTNFNPVHNDKIFPCNTSDSRLYSLALQAGAYSRYKRDENFAQGEYERFYKTWIDNSINGSIADYVFGYFEGDELHGMITLAIKEDYGQIGLFCVDINSRGKKIGTYLMDMALKTTKDLGKSRLEVATQKDNVRACNFYEKYGFSLLSQTCIRHKWFSNNLNK